MSVMDIIDRAIEEGLHISRCDTRNEQTWAAFETAARDKKIFLFGAGYVANLYWVRCRRPLEGILDNNSDKWNMRAEEAIEGAYKTDNADMLITGANILEKYNPQETIILVASTKYNDVIVRQLEELGHQNIFIMLIMEANYRQSHGLGENSKENILQYLYAQECYKEAIEGKKIVFRGFGTYSDHGKYITEQLLSIRSDLDIVWVVADSDTVVPNGVRTICIRNWKKYIYEMETAHIWIVNTVIPEYIKKKAGQIYIHTKHWASVTLKRFYLDAKTIIDVPEDVKLWRYNSSCMDYIITGSDFDTASCRRGFEFDKEVLRIGSPRTDAMFCKEQMRKKVLEQVSVPSDAKLLLYAPTYRYKQDNKKKHIAEARHIDLNLNAVKNTLDKRFGGEWYILLRLHPAVAKESPNVLLTEYTVDVSDYEDSQELASACDIMISDYSSIMFEPAFVGKPVFLFAPDRKEYIDKEYDLLIDYDSLPFPIAESNEELMRKIEGFQQDKYEKKVNSFLAQYGVSEDGHASERAAQFISKLISSNVQNMQGG